MQCVICVCGSQHTHPNKLTLTHTHTHTHSQCVIYERGTQRVSEACKLVVAASLLVGVGYGEWCRGVCVCVCARARACVAHVGVRL